MKSFLLIGIMTLMLCSFVSAFAVSSPGNIGLYPGESSEEMFSIQNIAEPASDMIVEILMVEGGEYISFLEGTTYDVDAGNVVPVKARISVPEDAKIGDVYKIKVTFKPTSIESTDGEGMVQFVSNYVLSLNVEIVPKPGEEAPEGISTTWIVLGIILIIIVIVLIWFANKSKKPVVAKK